MALYFVGDFFLDAAQKQALRDNWLVWIAGMPLLMLCCFIEHELEQALQTYDCMEQTLSVCSLDGSRGNAVFSSCLPWLLHANDARFMDLIGMNLGGIWGASSMPSRCDRDTTGTRPRCDWDAAGMRLRHDQNATGARPRCDQGAIAMRLGRDRDANRDAIGARMGRITCPLLKVVMEELLIQWDFWDTAFFSNTSGVPCACQSHCDGVAVASRWRPSRIVIASQSHHDRISVASWTHLNRIAMASQSHRDRMPVAFHSRSIGTWDPCSR